MGQEPYAVWWVGRRAAMIIMLTKIDVINSGEMCAALARPVHEGAVVLVADMTATTFCAPPGPRAGPRNTPPGGREPACRWAPRQPDVRRVLEVTGAGDPGSARAGPWSSTTASSPA